MKKKSKSKSSRQAMGNEGNHDLADLRQERAKELREEKMRKRKVSYGWSC